MVIEQALDTQLRSSLCCSGVHTWPVRTSGRHPLMLVLSVLTAEITP